MAWQIIAAVVSALGTAVQASASYNAARANEEIADNNAEIAERKKRKDEEALRRKKRLEIARLRSGMSSSGADISGSLMDVLDQSYLNAEMDIAELRLKGDQEVIGHKNKKAVHAATAKSSLASGLLGVTSDVAGGVIK